MTCVRFCSDCPKLALPADSANRLAKRYYKNFPSNSFNPNLHFDLTNDDDRQQQVNVMFCCTTAINQRVILGRRKTVLVVKDRVIRRLRRRSRWLEFNCGENFMPSTVCNFINPPLRVVQHLKWRNECTIITIVPFLNWINWSLGKIFIIPIGIILENLWVLVSFLWQERIWLVSSFLIYLLIPLSS